MISFSEKTSLISFFISLACFFAFSVVTLIPSFIFYLFLFLSFLTIMFLSKRWLHLERNLMIFLLLFLIPSLIGFYSYPVSWLLTNSSFDYSQLTVFGRVVNLFVYFLFILFLNSYFKNKGLSLPFLFYWIGVAFLMLTAFWQFLDVFLNLISFPFETRSHLHSTYEVQYSFNSRLTGIAREPSFLVMLIIDFIILSLLFFYGAARSLLVVFGLFLLVFSLSPSGYIAFSLAFVVALSMTRVAFLKTSFKFSSFNFIYLILGFVLFLPALLFLSNTSFFEYIYNRVADPRMIESGRAYMNYMPFYWAWESNPFGFLFGHGIKSYSIIGTYYNLPNGEPVHVTSNNLYVDTFWESGLIGLIMLIGFFAFVFVSIFKNKISKRQTFIAFFVLFDLVFSSFFRADFASFRFFILLYLIYVLINYDLRNVKGFYV